MSNGWIGVDLDGTLAEYHGWEGITKIGDPIPKMVARVKGWLNKGKDVRIYTARVCEQHADELEEITEAIERWCELYIDQKLPITNKKDMNMIECWDDRSIQVIKNTGERADGNKN